MSDSSDNEYGDDFVIKEVTSDDSSNYSLPERQQEVFDTNIPTTHRYLGKLNNISGYTLFDHGEVISLVAIHTNTLVLPGFTLPLVLSSQVEEAIMQGYLSRLNVFVLVCIDKSSPRLYKYGVTMEVFEKFSEHGILHLKAKGRQRCKIMPGNEIQHLGGRLQRITVKILAEPSVTSPIINTQLSALKWRRTFVHNNYKDLLNNYKTRRYHLAQYPHPSWIYDRNEICFYVTPLMEQLTQFYLKDDIPMDPVTLSYWFMQNFQLTYEERLHLMKLDSVIERLRLELKFLATERLLCCAMCKAELTNQKQVFAMSKDGVQSNYCNPNGHVFETVTVLTVKNFNLVGSSSQEFSWFPGYLWTIMQCRGCRSHIGWKFTSDFLHPSAFYGLAKSGLDIVKHSQANDSS